jgi:hypothetical protein
MKLSDIPPPLFVILWAGLWCIACFGISWAGGWRLLAQHYRCTWPVEGTRWQFRSAGFHRWSVFPASYGGILTLIGNEDGLRLSVFSMFRLGHPPIFIPWSEITATQVKRFFIFPLVRFDFVRVPSVAMFINPQLARKIQIALGYSWF